MAGLRVVLGFFVALVLAASMHGGASEVSESGTPETPPEEPAAGMRPPEAPIMYLPDTSKSVYDPNARVYSPLRGFWDNQTRQTMDANMSNELQRRRAQGWTREGGNVIKAMKEIRDDAKRGADVDPEALKRLATAARRKILEAHGSGVPTGPNSLDDVRNQEGRDYEVLRGRVLTRGSRGQQYLDALESKKIWEAEEKLEKERQRVEALQSEGNFMRKHPRQAEAASAA